MMRAAVCLALAFLAGCTGSARRDYYAAIEAASLAQAQAANARYDALMQMAMASKEAAPAAVVALALAQDPMPMPHYVESDALRWAQVIVPQVSTLGALYLQSALSRSLSSDQVRIQRAGIQAQAQQHGATISAIAGVASQPPPAPFDVSPILDTVAGIVGQSIEAQRDTAAIGYMTAEQIVENALTYAQGVVVVPPVVVPEQIVFPPVPSP